MIKLSWDICLKKKVTCGVEGLDGTRGAVRRGPGRTFHDAITT